MGHENDNYKWYSQIELSKDLFKLIFFVKINETYFYTGDTPKITKKE